MTLVATHPKAIFVGQAVTCAGTAMTDTLRHIPPDKKREFPVAENMQMGFCIGLALAGYLPVCIFPRINFMLEAISQLVQHLDKIQLFSGFRPKVIIRTAIATQEPLDPGPQHLGDYCRGFDAMLTTVRLYHLHSAAAILPAYRKALDDANSTILVEDYREDSL